MQVLRNLGRRKLRSSLTISGIVIGVLALTSLGAISQKVSTEIDSSLGYYSSAIEVASPDGQLPFITDQQVATVAALPGVAAVYPFIALPADPTWNTGPLTPDAELFTWIPGITRYSSFDLRLAAGRFSSLEASGEVVLGSTVAQHYGKRVGDSIDLPVRPKNPPAGFAQRTFRVVGITQPTNTVPDTVAWIGLPDARALMLARVPEALKATFDTSHLANSMFAFGARGTDIHVLDRIADAINRSGAGLRAVRPSDIVSQYRQGTQLFTAITTGVALLALVIGGLSVVNTMLMAVGERAREIGVKKAVGASTRHILLEFLVESAAIGAAGGGIGYLLGVAVTALGNRQIGDIFLVTPALTAFTLGFAVALGAVAGIIPAWRAARLDPVFALRAQ